MERGGDTPRGDPEEAGRLISMDIMLEFVGFPVLYDILPRN